MADQAVNQGTCSSNASEDNPDSTLELNIKTLDSQTYTFKANKNMLVSLFKEKIANEVGVPVGQQRLIFRGRVLKDDHPLSEYHLENGHTLHLVVRQLTETQPSFGASSGETTTYDGNQGNDTNGGAPRNRVGQISHSVVLGTFNVGDQGGPVVPDISQVIGAVLNSLGIGNQPTNTSNGTQSSLFSNVYGQAPPTSVSQPVGSNVLQSQDGNSSQSGQSFSGHPFQSSPQVVHIPVTAATAIPIPSIHAPIPDSLETLLEFINRMVQALSQNGYQPDTSAANSGDQPRTELPRNRRGPSTPEALSVVLRNAQHLLNDQAIAALSHIAGRLEREGASSDSALRGQIQTEATQVGLAMQHLGALLLELGRTILTLRMGESPAESYLNAGPAVYISPTGPNPIMVQPFPLQTNSLFSGTTAQSTPVTVGSLGIGTAPRHINIHIHAGTSLSPMVSAVGNRQSTGDEGQGAPENSTGSAATGSVRVLPVRNVVAAAVPPRPTSGIAVSTAPQTRLANLQAPDSSSISSIVSEINSRLRDAVNNRQARNPGAPGTESSEVHVPGDLDVVNNSAATGTAEELSGSPPERSELTPQSECKKEGGTEALGRPTSSKGEPMSNNAGNSEDVKSSKDKANSGPPASSIPLGLGLGSLERKKRSKQPKPSVKDEDTNPGSSVQQPLKSLFSGSSSSEGSDNPVDVSTALDGLLGGISRQTGVGSPNILRNMMQQLTSNPQIMNTVQQIARQVDGREIENIMSGEAQGLDFSRIVQQMMPLVSRAFSQGGPTQPASSPPPRSEMTGLAENPNDEQMFQVNVDPVAQVIEQSNSPGDVFRTIVESAVQIPVGDSTHEDMMNELCGDEGLAHEYAELLRRDIQSRFQGDLGPQGNT
ncbi:PREDICTED: large proline-rich protein BAG6 isoform X2 [Tarenaya hassleriana]|uniref:large proline-rich protein BAG6 isoform X2 n=1 Tax=Tarenaya hassleriana TaxID=28532 RepID=UPI00053C64DE|nr:PREDICTED: large proline-rich protein BAG6 isoform X2 [Tarenaya hassleriana]